MSQALPRMAGVPFPQTDTVRIGIIGTGSRSQGLQDCLTYIPAASIVAITDPVAKNIADSLKLITDAGRPAPVVEQDADHLIARDDLDLVLIASPWDTHTRYAVAAMEAGKHVGVEVPAAISVDECWQLVDTSERTRRHCVMLENCCYGRSEMTVLNLARQGAFGDLLHAGAAYIHDLRELLFDLDWRRAFHTLRDGNLYPTHGLGPVASYFDLGRGDRMTKIVSMSSPQIGLDRWRTKNRPDTAPENYVCGDVNTSIIQTAKGRTILLQHQVIGARPYDRINQLVGTNGVFSDYPARIFLEDDPLGRTERQPCPVDEEELFSPEWYEDLAIYEDAYLPELWRAHESDEGLMGHGGMDYLMLVRLISAFTEGRAPDMDVYDAASWSVPGPLSADSVAQGGMPVEFPDFTRGRWSAAYPGLP